MAKGIYLACPLVNWDFHEGGEGKGISDQHFAVCSGAITRFLTTGEDYSESGYDCQHLGVTPEHDSQGVYSGQSRGARGVC